MTNDPALFFQIAAAVIPVLLVTTAQSRIADPDRVADGPPTWRLFVALAAASIVVYSLIAELFSLELAFEPDAALGARAAIVAEAVVLLAGLMGVSLLLPWFTRLLGQSRIVLRALLMVGLLAFVSYGAIDLGSAVSRAGLSRFEARLTCVIRQNDEIYRTSVAASTANEKALQLDVQSGQKLLARLRAMNQDSSLSLDTRVRRALPILKKMVTLTADVARREHASKAVFTTGTAALASRARTLDEEMAIVGC